MEFHRFSSETSSTSTIANTESMNDEDEQALTSQETAPHYRSCGLNPDGVDPSSHHHHSSIGPKSHAPYRHCRIEKRGAKKITPALSALHRISGAPEPGYKDLCNRLLDCEKKIAQLQKALQRREL